MFMDLQLAGYLIDENVESGDDSKIEASKPGVLIGRLYSLLLPPIEYKPQFS